MIDNDKLLGFFLDNLRKLFYPEEWIDIDMTLSKSELFTLLLLDRYSEIIMSQIADYVNVPMSTATGVVDRLVKNGYINRDRSEADRRIVTIKLTEKGKAFVDNFKATIFKYIEMVNNMLTDEERQVITGIFMKLVDLLNTKNKEPDGEEKKEQIKKINIE